MILINRRKTLTDADMNINDLTYQINGAIFEVSWTLGAGFLEEAQILNYLKAIGIQIGFLVNFKHPKAEIIGISPRSQGPLFLP